MALSRPARLLLHRPKHSQCFSALPNGLIGSPSLYLASHILERSCNTSSFQHCCRVMSTQVVEPQASPQKRMPSAHVKRLAKDLIALPPAELAELRKMCRERLMVKPANHRGPLPKNYNPELKVKRSDRPFPL